jgi:hypothetical protein
MDALSRAIITAHGPRGFSRSFKVRFGRAARDQHHWSSIVREAAQWISAASF